MLTGGLGSADARARVAGCGGRGPGPGPAAPGTTLPPARAAPPTRGGGPPLGGPTPRCLRLPGRPPAVVDVSMGRTTYGAVLAAAARGEALPGGVAVRADGSGERDPGAVVAGEAAIAPF